MIVRIDHVGVATNDADGVGTLLSALGMARNDGGIAEAYRVSCDFWQLSPGAGQVSVEVVAPVADGSAIETQLSRRGSGPYHIAFETDDVDGDLTRLRGRGLVPVDREPCGGARPGMRVAFLYLPKPAAFLVELVEYSPPL